RHQRLSHDPLPARADLGTRETPGRHDGDAFCVDGYGTLVDRATDEWRGRPRQAGRHSSTVRHTPTARGADRTIERAVTRGLARPAAPVVASLAVLAAACSGSGGAAESTAVPTTVAATTTTTSPPVTTRPRSTTTTIATTTTTVPEPVHLPLTGELVDDEADVPDQPALVVKIDNHPRARPQAGLNEADIVFEE